WPRAAPVTRATLPSTRPVICRCVICLDSFLERCASFSTRCVPWSPQPATNLLVKATDAVMAPPCDQHPWFETCKAQANCGAVDQVGRQVVGERLDVVLPDRLVDAGERQDDVVREPNDSPEGQTLPPVDQVCDRAGTFVGQVMPKNRVRDLSADLAGCRCVIPLSDTLGGFPREEALVAAAPAVSEEPDEVHRGGAYGAGDRAPDEDACGFHCTVS